MPQGRIAVARSALIVSFAANIVLAALSTAFLPATVAIHFTTGGAPNDWAPRHVSALIFIAMNAILFAAILSAPRLSFAMPARWINIPRKDFWLAPGNRARTQAKISALLDQFGAVLLLFIFIIDSLVIEANLSCPVRLNERLFFVCLILFVVYTAAWTIAFNRSFRDDIRTGSISPGNGASPPAERRN